MKPTPTLIYHYYICQREVWLLSRNLDPDPANPFIEIGKLISEESYNRERKEIHLENMIIDVLKIDGAEMLVGEIKKSSRCEKAAKMQLAYYLFRLKRLGINATGQLLFPREKKRIPVNLTEEIEEELKRAEMEINRIISMESPPPPVKTKFCKNCGYKEFCWS